jgi:Type IV secretion system pilin
VVIMNTLWTLLAQPALPVGVTALHLAASHLDSNHLGWVDTVIAHRAVTMALSPGADVSVLALVASVEQVLDNIRNWIMGILGGLATLFLTIGAARYLMAGGDPAEVERARAAFRSAGFGYALALLAPLIVEILKNIVGA